MSTLLAIVGHLAAGPAGAARFASEHAFPGVELSVAPNATAVADARREALAAGAADLRLRYHLPFHGCDVCHPSPAASRDALAATADVIRALSSGDVLSVHAPLRDGLAHEQDEALAAEHLSRLVAVGAECGVTVAVENLRWGPTSDPERFVELVDRCGARVTFDVGHAASSDAAARGYTAARFARDLGKRIVGAHVYGRENERHHPPAALDEVRDVLGALREAGCDWWTIELTSPDEVLATRAMLAEFLDAGRGLA
jgi:sugar phosphate isomerase/epimerase